MSANHETGRSAELLADARQWLLEDDQVADLVGADGAVEPVQIARESEADPRLSIGVSTASSERDNRLEEKQLEVRAIVDATPAFVKDAEADGSLLELMQLKDRVGDVLTTSRDGWGAEGVITDEEIAYTENVNRYLGVTSFAYERTDPNTTFE